MRAKLDRRQKSSFTDDTTSVRSSTYRHNSQGREKLQVTFDEEMLQQAQTGKQRQWKAQMAEIKEKVPA